MGAQTDNPLSGLLRDQGVVILDGALATELEVYVGVWVIVALIVIGVIAEAIEFFAGAAGAKKFGGSKRGMIGAIVGGLVGGIALTPVIPIPIVGTIVGSIIGTFAGAFLVESGIVGKTNRESGKAGMGAAIGRTVGIVVKTGFGLLMFFVSAVASIPIRDSMAISTTNPMPNLTTVPTTAPTTVPSTMSSTPTTLPTTQP